MQSDQQQWLKTKRDACQDGACLKTVYLERLAELDPLQPGATALKNVTLPVVPALVWVIRPAADTVAAPPNPKAKPYEAIGTLVDDIATNANSDGIALRTKDGTRIPLQLTMFLDGPTQAAVASLSKQVLRCIAHAAMPRPIAAARTSSSRAAASFCIACRPRAASFHMPTRYWLMKCEPAAYTIDDLTRDGRTSWEGVRNYQARNFMRDQMQEGDPVLFYASNAEPSGVTGLAPDRPRRISGSFAFKRGHKYYDAASTADKPILVHGGRRRSSSGFPRWCRSTR